MALNNLNDLATTNAGLFRVGGMYGSAWRDGRQLAEMVEVQATIAVNRIDIPLVGRTKTGYKPGRETRDGTIRIQKIDTFWELEVQKFLATNLDQRRANRASGTPTLKPWQLLLEYDDPDALGYEKWQLEGCLLWSLPLGFAVTDDIRELEFPFTWESETPLSAFVRTGVQNPTTGLPAVSYPSGMDLGIR